MTRERNLRWATIALVGAGLLFTYAFVRALVVDDPPTLPDAATAPPAVNKPAAPPPSVEGPVKSSAPSKKWTGLTSNALQLAVETDPFQPDRVRAPERYRLPGEEVIVEEPPPSIPPPPPPQFRVLGTIVGGPGTGVAVIQTPTGSRVLGVGESLNGFTLASVTPRAATVEGNGGRTYSLSVEEGSPTRAARGARAGRAGATPQGGRGGAANAEQAAQVRAAIQRLQQLGVGGAQLQQMERMLEQLNREVGMIEGRAFQADRIEIMPPGRGASVGTDRVIIRPRVDTMRSPTNRRND